MSNLGYSRSHSNTVSSIISRPSKGYLWYHDYRFAGTDSERSITSLYGLRGDGSPQMFSELPTLGADRSYVAFQHLFNINRFNVFILPVGVRLGGHTVGTCYHTVRPGDDVVVAGTYTMADLDTFGRKPAFFQEPTDDDKTLRFVGYRYRSGSNSSYTQVSQLRPGTSSPPGPPHSTPILGPPPDRFSEELGQVEIRLSEL